MSLKYAVSQFNKLHQIIGDINNVALYISKKKKYRGIIKSWAMGASVGSRG